MKQNSVREEILVSITSSSSSTSESSSSSSSRSSLASLARAATPKAKRKSGATSNTEGSGNSSVTAVQITSTRRSSSSSSSASATHAARMDRHGSFHRETPTDTQSPDLPETAQNDGDTEIVACGDFSPQGSNYDPTPALSPSPPHLLATTVDMLTTTASILTGLSANMLHTSHLASASPTTLSSPDKHTNSRDQNILKSGAEEYGLSLLLKDDEEDGTAVCIPAASKGRLLRTPSFACNKDHALFDGVDTYVSSALHTTATRTECTSAYNKGLAHDDLHSISSPYSAKRGQRDTEDLLRSELAGVTVKCRRLEEEVHSCRASAEALAQRKDDLTRQLDAHRQEHARQAATIISLRTRLQESEDTVMRLEAALQRSELSVASLTREGRGQSDRILQLEDRLRTHLEEREEAEQRGGVAQLRLGELVTAAASVLGVPRGSGEPHLLNDTITRRLTELVKEVSNLRRDKAALQEAAEAAGAAAEAARQTVGRLAGQLDGERRYLAEQRLTNEVMRKDEEDLRTKLRTAEEELISLRDRLHGSNKSHTAALEELHGTETKLQQTRDECVLLDHRRQQNEVEWRGILNTMASLVSALTVGAEGRDGARVNPSPEDITRALQARVATARETHETAERLKHKVCSLEDQVAVQAELYQSATQRAVRAEDECRTCTARVRTLEADLHAAEQAREDSHTQKDKNGRLLSRIVQALGLHELGDEGMADPDLVVCKVQQLAKLEGEKLVDKTTTVYQLQRKVKSLREAVDRKDLHLDMMRRKLALTEESSRASKRVEEERDDLMARYRRQTRALERAVTEAGELRLQTRDLRGQLAAAEENKSRAASLEERYEEVTARLTELEAVRGRQQRKMAELKEQARVACEQAREERRVSDATLDGLSHEAAVARQELREAARRERQLLEFRRVVMDLLSSPDPPDCPPGTATDLDTLGRLQRLVAGQRELASLSRRLDDVTMGTTSRPCSAHTIVSRSSSGRSLSPSRPVSATHPAADHHSRLPPLDPCLEELSLELRALTEHAHNHRPHARVLQSSPQRGNGSGIIAVHRGGGEQPQMNGNIGNNNKQDMSVSECSQKQLKQKDIDGSGSQQSSCKELNRPTLAQTRCFKQSPHSPSSPPLMRRSPTPPLRQPSPPTRQSPSSSRPTPSPSPILTRPGSATRRCSVQGKTNNVSFLEQGEDSSEEEDMGISNC